MKYLGNAKKVQRVIEAQEKAEKEKANDKKQTKNSPAKTKKESENREKAGDS